MTSFANDERFLRLSRWAAFFLGLILPAVGYWAAQLRVGTTFVEAWLPGNDVARTKYREFRKQFGEDQYLIVSWPSCTISDPRLLKMNEKLLLLASTHPELHISSIGNSQALLSTMVDSLSSATKDQRRVLTLAKNRLRGIALGKNDEAFVSLALAQAEVETRADLVEHIRRIGKEILGDEKLILAGEPFQIHIIDKSSRETMRRLVPPSACVAMFIAWLCIRHVSLTLIVMGFAGLGQLMGMAAVSLFVGEMAVVLVVLPTLVFMLTLSASVHLASYFVRADQRDSSSAGVQTVRLGGWPCSLASLTTAIGFGSLAASQLAPVWRFGSLSAISLIATTALTLSAFPYVSQRFAKLTLWKRKTTEDAEQTLNGQGSTTLAAAANTIADFTNKFSLRISLIGILVLVLSSLGLGRLKTSTEFQHMFPPESEAVESLLWVREHLGPLESLEVLVSLPHGKDEGVDFDELLLLEELQTQLATLTGVDSVFSVSSFLPPLPRHGGLSSTVRKTLVRKKVESQLSELKARGLFSNENNRNTWRFTLRLRETQHLSFVEVRAELDDRVQSILKDSAAAASLKNRFKPPLGYEVTGLRSIVDKAHYALISDLVTSFAAAFLLITPIMMWIAGGVIRGLVLMIPNVLPVALVFGIMGWAGVKLDVASILTASVALGIAVDDTLHFVIAFLRRRQSGDSPDAATHYAIAVCAKPMLQTTLICSAAMSPFFFSDFLPTSKFALLMILILSGAIVGDLLLLPAILQSPWGRNIGMKGRKNQIGIEEGEAPS